MPQHRISDQLVTQFWQFVTHGSSYSEAWQRLREWSEEDGRRRGLDDPTNGWRSASGRAFEAIARRLVTDAVTQSALQTRVALYPWDEAPDWIRNGILAERVWPKDEVREPAIALSMVDLIAVSVGTEGDPDRVLCVYSCKSSLAERYQQDLYWAEKLRARSVKFCLATIDQRFVEYATGVSNPIRDSKAITLGRALYDRIYLLTIEQITRSPRVFKRIEDVVQDLELWLQAD